MFTTPESFPTWVTTIINYAHVYAFAALALGQQSTEMMYNVCVHPAYSCRVPNMVERQIENERASHHRHFLGLKLSLLF